MRTPLHHVLWTGGWDSTFRVADLVLTHARTVQPVYVRDPRRRTAQKELDRMAQLVRLMDRRQPGAAARVRPPLVLDLGTMPRDPEVTAATERVAAAMTVYEQYRFLPHVPFALGRDDVEIGWQDDATFLYFPRHAYRQEPAPEPDAVFRLDPARCDPDRYTMFARFSFPVIHMTKPRMAEVAQQRGFLSILEQTWTCRWPTVLGNPCGFCVPCQDTRREGRAHRVPAPSSPRRIVHRAKWEANRRGQEWRVRAGAAMRAIRGSRR